MVHENARLKFYKKGINNRTFINILALEAFQFPALPWLHYQTGRHLMGLP